MRTRSARWQRTSSASRREGPVRSRQRPSGSRNICKAIEKNTVTIGVGPAGTGKTYLAVAEAVARLPRKDGQPHHPDAPRRGGGGTARLSAGRPAKQGRSVSAARFTTRCSICSARKPINKYLERGNIEVAPLAYMRGRTLDDSFIILDEAQNTTREQMKMFLTRLGFGSQDRHHRRRDADRPAERQGQRSQGGGARAGRHRGYRHLPPDGQRRGAPCAGAADRRRL